MELIPDEIKAIINETCSQVSRKMGKELFIALLLIIVLFLGLGKICIDKSVKKQVEKYRTDLQKDLQKNLEVWKTQKDLTFEFVGFLETELFNNPTLQQTKDDILRKLNQYYAKLYLVFETDILNKITALLDNKVSSVQRYYLYREIRIQLFGNLLEKKPDYNECPYVSQKAEKQLMTIAGKEECKTFDELQEIYPFIEEGDEPNTLKYLPYFATPKE